MFSESSLAYLHMMMMCQCFLNQPPDYFIAALPNVSETQLPAILDVFLRLYRQHTPPLYLDFKCHLLTKCCELHSNCCVATLFKHRFHITVKREKKGVILSCDFSTTYANNSPHTDPLSHVGTSEFHSNGTGVENMSPPLPAHDTVKIHGFMRSQNQPQEGDSGRTTAK